MSDDNQQHPSPNSFHEGGYRKKAYYYHNSGVHLPDQGDSRPPTEYPQQGNPSLADAPHDPLDGGGNIVQRQTSPRNLQQGKTSTDVPSLDKVVKDLKDSSGPVRGFVPGFPLSSAAPSPSSRNVIQSQTLPRNLQQGKPSTDVPSLDKVRKAVQGQTSPGNLQQGKPLTNVSSLETAGNVVQRQTTPGNLQQGKPSTEVPSLDKVVKDLKDSSSPVEGSVPGFPPSSTAPSSSAGNVIQRQTSSRNPQQRKPLTDVPSLDKVVGDLKDSSGPVGDSISNFPPSSAASSPSEKETNCIIKCLAALSPCCGLS